MLELDTQTEEYLTNPWPLFKKFRQEAPICWSESERLFNVFRHEHIEKLFMDRRFTVEFPWRTTGHLFGPTLIDMEGNEHLRLKKLISATVLNNDNIRKFAESFARPTISRLIDDVIYKPSFDFMEEIANRVPTLMTCQFLGIPLDQEKWLFSKMMVLMNHLGETVVNYDAVSNVHKELEIWLTKILDHKLASEGADLGYKQMFDCVRNETLETIRIVFWTFLAGGIETSMCLLGNAMVILSQHQDWFVRLAENTSMARTILDEILRLEPVQGSTVRFATEDLEFAGVSIKKNQCVKLVLSSACRDENIYKNPDVFDPTRPGAKNLTFAIGIHACMGRNFTLTNSEIVLKTFWKKIQGIRELDKNFSVIRGGMFRKPESVWIQSKVDNQKQRAM